MQSNGNRRQSVLMEQFDPNQLIQRISPPFVQMVNPNRAMHDYMDQIKVDVDHLNHQLRHARNDIEKRRVQVEILQRQHTAQDVKYKYNKND